MKKTEFAKECAMVASIIADNIFEKLHKACQRNGGGYMMCVDTISEWALEFVRKHEKNNWEEVLDKGLTPLSSEISEVICWDDCVIDWAHYKLNLFE